MLQFATQHCCIASWKALLHVLFTTHLKHCHATKFVVASWKNLLKKVEASSTWCNMLLQLATTKFCFATMFEVGGKTANNAFQLATQQCCVKVEGKCCPYYRALSSLEKKRLRFRIYTLMSKVVQDKWELAYDWYYEPSNFMTAISAMPMALYIRSSDDEVWLCRTRLVFEFYPRTFSCIKLFFHFFPKMFLLCHFWLGWGTWGRVMNRASASQIPKWLGDLSFFY